MPLTLEQLEAMDARQREQHVLVVQDPFTSYYDAQVVADFVRLVEKLGYQPVVLPFSPNGKAQHMKGFLTRFARTARRKPLTSSTAWRSSACRWSASIRRWCCAIAMNTSRRWATSAAISNVMLVHEWLPSGGWQRREAADGQRRSRGICSATAPKSPRCRVPAPKQWAAIFARFGAKLENVSVGCCGMAGTYGHEVKNQANSLGIYELSWHPATAAFAATALSGDGLLLPQPGETRRGQRRAPPITGFTGIDVKKL